MLFGIYKKKFDKYKFEKLYKPIKKNNIRFISNFSKKKFNTHNLDLDELEFAKKFLNLNNSEKNNYYEKLFQIFSEANFIVKKNNANIIFVYLPNTFTAFEDISIFENKENKIFLSKYSKISQKIFFNICNDLKLKCLNTVEIFKKHNQRNAFPTHFPKSNALTNVGHNLTAKMILNKICDDKIYFLFSEECKN